MNAGHVAYVGGRGIDQPTPPHVAAFSVAADALPGDHRRAADDARLAAQIWIIRDRRDHRWLSMLPFQSIVPAIVLRRNRRRLRAQPTQFNLSRVPGPSIAGLPIRRSVGATSCFVSARGFVHTVHRCRAVDPAAVRRTGRRDADRNRLRGQHGPARKLAAHCSPCSRPVRAPLVSRSVPCW